MSQDEELFMLKEGAVCPVDLLDKHIRPTGNEDFDQVLRQIGKTFFLLGYSARVDIENLRMRLEIERLQEENENKEDKPCN